MGNMVDCNIVVSGFELQSHYYTHFQTNTLGRYGLLYPSSYGLKSAITVILQE